MMAPGVLKTMNAILSNVMEGKSNLESVCDLRTKLANFVGGGSQKRMYKEK